MNLKVIVTTEAELAELIAHNVAEATKPLIEAINSLRAQVENKKDVYSVAELAEKSGFGKTMVYDWINKGRLMPDGKRVYLKTVSGLTDGSIRIRHEAWKAFLNRFPDVVY